MQNQSRANQKDDFGLRDGRLAADAARPRVIRQTTCGTGRKTGRAPKSHGRWQSRSLFLSPHRPAAARVAPNACAVARDIAPDPYRSRGLAPLPGPEPLWDGQAHQVQSWRAVQPRYEAPTD